MARSISTRLARLERRRGPRFWRPCILTIHDDELPGEVVGYQSGSDTFLRADGEAVEALRARAWATGPNCLLVTLYGAS